MPTTPPPISSGILSLPIPPGPVGAAARLPLRLTGLTLLLVPAALLLRALLAPRLLLVGATALLLATLTPAAAPDRAGRPRPGWPWLG